MKLLAIFEFLLTVVLASGFNMRGLVNDTLKQQLIMPVMSGKEAGVYARITNGKPAAPNRFPYQVGLRTWYAEDDAMRCGGSLISNKWVLTASHCLIDGLRVSVYLGSVILPEPHYAIYRVPKRNMIEHRNYNRRTFQYDIGLVKIPEVHIGDGINVVQLPPRGFGLTIGSYAYLAGWGITSDSSDTFSPNLLYSKFKIIERQECVDVYGPLKIYSGKFCTGTTKGISACKGDSGGPLVLKDHNIQIGIASFAWSLGCEKGKPVAYTRVESYLDWIHEKTGLEV